MRQVNDPPVFFSKAAELRVSRHPDNFVLIALRRCAKVEVFSQWVFTREIAAGHILADHRHFRGMLIILGTNVAPGDERYAHRLEIFQPYHVDPDFFILMVLGRPRYVDSAHAINSDDWAGC